MWISETQIEISPGPRDGNHQVQIATLCRFRANDGISSANSDHVLQTGKEYRRRTLETTGGTSRKLSRCNCFDERQNHQIQIATLAALGQMTVYLRRTQNTLLRLARSIAEKRRRLREALR